MRTMNRITLIGRLGQDPELKVGQNGIHWMQLSLATDRNRKDGDTWVKETDWHRVRLFGRDADAVLKLGAKGTLLSVEGEVRYETWTDRDNHKRWSALVYADRVVFLADLRPQAPAATAVAVERGVEAAAAK